MNKIRNIEVLEALRERLPDRPLRPKSRPPASPEPAQERLSDEEAEQYGQAFDALLTLWQVVGTMPPIQLSPAVARAQGAATMRLRPLLSGAMKIAS